MQRSKQAMMYDVPLGSARWTGGFWGERFGVYSGTSLWDMWDTWKDAGLSHGYRNFEVAAGTVEGAHQGPPFHDGDLYKWLEAVAAVYAISNDRKLDALMDTVIDKIVRSQRADGYIHTPVIIEERSQAAAAGRKKDDTVIGITVGGEDEKTAFANRLNFETYNLGHLMTAGAVHYRATGKLTLLDCSLKAADFLYNFYKTASDELARNAICPSHYMGVAEIYRLTGEPKYLELLTELINIRGRVKNGEDHNQDRTPFRDQYEATGHAVRANYLYAGVADLYAETGEQQLKDNLTSIWNDIVNRKIYITGGCGALYDGVSPDGTTYIQPSIQQIHQAYGRAYQLPNESSHNETCAQIGMMLFSWRMLHTTGEARYAEQVENELYNGIMSSVSLDGRDYFYTNALRKTAEFPYVMRWPKTRQRYISCFCCPPNTLRTLCEAQEYAYTVSEGTLWCHLYGENRLKTKEVEAEQRTAYPYDGKVVIAIKKAKGLNCVKLRIPEWCDKAEVIVNGMAAGVPCKADTYVELRRNFKRGDVIELRMDMRPRLLESDPLVEENRNQVAVKRGPIVYCLEAADIEGGCRVDDVVIPADIRLTPVPMTIGGHSFHALEGEALAVSAPAQGNALYREASKADRKVKIRLIPYYAWGNRGDIDMTVWMPVSK